MVAALQPGRPGGRVSDIFREIEDELRRDNLLKLWSRYGRYIIIAVAVVLVIAGGVVAWRDHLANQRRAASVQYSGALSLIGQSKDKDAARMFAEIAQGGGGFALLAQFERAGLLAKSGDRAGAIAIYDAIAKSSDAGPEFRQLATLLSVMQALPDTGPKAAIARLAPLTESGQPWRASALSLTAAAELKAGDKKTALAVYKKLADDLTAPAGLRAHAAEMASALAP